MAAIKKASLVRLVIPILLATFASCTPTGLSGPVKPDRRITVVVDATELASAFEENEQGAFELFGNKQARIRGVFAKSEPLADGNFALTFKTSKETFRPVRCVIHAPDSIAINRLSGGDELTITGTIAGFAESSYFISVEDCSIERP